MAYNYSHKPHLTDDEKRDIWERVQRNETVETCVKAYDDIHDHKTIRRWHWGFSRAKEKREIKNYVKQASLPYDLTEKAFEEMCRLDQMWMTGWGKSNEFEKSEGDSNSHIASLLKACERLAAQVEDLPSPEDVVDYAIDNSRKFLGSYIPRDPLAGCLERMQLPPGASINDPAFRLLREHTYDDPHWNELGWHGAWWIEYNYEFVDRILDLIESSCDDLNERLVEAQQLKDYRFLPTVKTPFAAIPIKDAFRVSMGLPPGQWSQIPTTVSASDCHNKVTGELLGKAYSITYGGMLIVSGVDRSYLEIDSGEIKKDYEPWRPALLLHQEFIGSILSSPEPLEIVETWRKLQKRASEFALWLKSLSARDFERKRCSLCDRSIATRYYPMMLEVMKQLHSGNSKES